MNNPEQHVDVFGRTYTTGTGSRQLSRAVPMDMILSPNRARRLAGARPRGCIGNPQGNPTAYHYGRWGSGNPPVTSADAAPMMRIDSRLVRVTAPSRVRGNRGRLRIAIPSARGEPCEIHVVQVGSFSIFYICCGGHCAPLPIAINPMPGAGARPRRPRGLATPRSAAGNCWIGVGHNNVVMLCCDVGDDTHCAPLPITFGPLPSSRNPTVPIKRMPILQPLRNPGAFPNMQRNPMLSAQSNPGQHAVGDEWWEYSADLTADPVNNENLRELLYAHGIVPASHSLANVGDIQYRREGILPIHDHAIRIRASSNHNGTWYTCTFNLDNWSLVSCVEQPSVPGGAVQYQHPGFGYTLGQPIVDWSRRVFPSMQRNPMLR